MQQDFIETCMLMSVERDLLEQIQFEEILTIIQKCSDLMSKLLTVETEIVLNYLFTKLYIYAPVVAQRQFLM